MKIDPKMIISPSASIKSAMRRINSGGFRLVFVVGRNGKLYGSLTDGDIRRAILQGVSLRNPVAEVMNSDPLSIDACWDNTKILNFLKSKKVLKRGMPDPSFFPVVDERQRMVDVSVFGNGELKLLSQAGNKKSLGERALNRVLIIGGAGYIGSVLTRLLLKVGYSVNVLDAFLYNQRSLDSLAGHKRLKIVRGDSRHVEDVIEAIRDADAVVHLAELVGDPVCAFEPRQALETNYHATKLVANLCKDFHIRRFVYTSSCSVYGASASEAFLIEESSLNPVSLYARMKIDSEKTLLDMSDGSFSPTILRLATVYGESFRPRFDLVVNLLTAKAVHEKKIPIFGGQQWRPNVHVEDVGRAIVKVIEAPMEKVDGQIFNVGSSEQNYRIVDLGREVQKVIQDAKLVISEDDTDPRNYRVGFTKIKNSLDFQPLRDISYGVRSLKKQLIKDNLQYTDKFYSNVKFLQGVLK
jgi:nucleoside-diphosphate-sugar epimerase